MNNIIFPNGITENNEFFYTRRIHYLYALRFILNILWYLVWISCIVIYWSTCRTSTAGPQRNLIGRLYELLHYYCSRVCAVEHIAFSKSCHSLWILNQKLPIRVPSKSKVLYYVLVVYKLVLVQVVCRRMCIMYIRTPCVCVCVCVKYSTLKLEKTSS